MKGYSLIVLVTFYITSLHNVLLLLKKNGHKVELKTPETIKLFSSVKKGS